MLEIDWTTDEPAVVAGQLLVVPLREAQDGDAITQRFGAAIRDAVDRSPFNAKAGESFSFTREIDGAIQNVMLAGPTALTEPAALRQLAHDAACEV